MQTGEKKYNQNRRHAAGKPEAHINALRICFYLFPFFYPRKCEISNSAVDEDHCNEDWQKELTHSIGFQHGNNLDKYNGKNAGPYEKLSGLHGLLFGLFN